MIILEDTRQQAGKHPYKHDYFIANGISVKRTTLSVGDYQLAGNGSCAVDTKKDIQELIGNIQFKQLKKSDIKERLLDGLRKYNISEDHFDTFFEMIVGNDTGRDVDGDITRYVYSNRLNEGIVSLIQELYLRRRGRFHRELVRAQIEGVKLYILVENSGGYVKKPNIVQPYIGRLEDLHSWINPRLFVRANGKQKYPNAMRGETLMKACMTMQKKYGCTFLFCRPEDAGAVIHRTLLENSIRKEK